MGIGERPGIGLSESDLHFFTLFYAVFRGSALLLPFRLTSHGVGGGLDGFGVAEEAA